MQEPDFFSASKAATAARRTYLGRRGTSLGSWYRLNPPPWKQERAFIPRQGIWTGYRYNPKSMYQQKYEQTQKQKDYQTEQANYLRWLYTRSIRQALTAAKRYRYKSAGSPLNPTKPYMKEDWNWKRGLRDEIINAISPVPIPSWFPPNLGDLRFRGDPKPPDKPEGFWPNVEKRTIYRLLRKIPPNYTPPPKKPNTPPQPDQTLNNSATCALVDVLKKTSIWNEIPWSSKKTLRQYCSQTRRTKPQQRRYIRSSFRHRNPYHSLYRNRRTRRYY